jgi:hypothetical protein
MKDFARVMPKLGYENIPVLFNQFSTLFHEAEYQTVIEGRRKAGTIHISQDNMDKIFLRLNKHGLIFTPLHKSGYYQGFAHSHKSVTPGEPFFWYGCITRNKEDAETFQHADSSHDHNTVGRLLGFPSCCAKYFSDNFPLNYDPIWLGLEGDVTGYPECNQLLRYFGCRITSCLSCSPTCKSAREVGVSWLEVMRGIDKPLTDKLISTLSQPMTWDSYHGVVQVETSSFIAITHTFPFSYHRIINWRATDEAH